MKKYVTILLALAACISMGAVSLAAYPQSTKDWNVKVTINDEGGIDVTYTIDPSDMAAVGWTEMAIYDHELDITDKDMVGEGMPYDSKIKRGGGESIAYVDSRTINKGALGEDSYPFEEGKTYYIYMMACDGANWVWNTVPTKFTYSTTGEVDPGETGDFSAIAYAAAALAGCGALVIRKKK